MNPRMPLIVLIFAALLGACDSNDTQTAPADATALVGLSLDTLQEERWQRDRDLFVAKVNELGGAVEVRSANTDDQQQIADVQSLITKNCDVIVIVPHDGQVMAKGVELAHEAGIPAIAYDRLIRDSDVGLYVTFDNIKVGNAQSQWLIDHMQFSADDPARIVRIYGSPTDNNARMFKAGQDEVLQPYIDSGEIVVIHEDWAEDWRPDNAKRIVNAAVTNHGTDFDGILASNDGTAGGAIQALTEEGIAGQVLVTGQDADLVACQRIAAGTQGMTVYKPLEVLAEGAAELAMRTAQGEEVETNDTVDNGLKAVPTVFFPIVTVDQDNLVDTIIADGFHSYDEVYKSVPENQRPPRPESESRRDAEKRRRRGLEN